MQEAEAAGRPDGNGFWRDYAVALAQVGRLAEVRVRLERLTNEWPSEPFAWSARAWALCTTDGVTEADRRNALDCAERAVELSNRQGPVMLATLAEAHFRTGEPKKALEVLKECPILMGDHNAEWLTLEEIDRRRQLYRDR